MSLSAMLTDEPVPSPRSTPPLVGWMNLAWKRLVFQAQSTQGGVTSAVFTEKS
jgi:hypothetical protein